MLLVCIHSYIKPILRYKFLILDSYHPDTLYVCEQGCEDPWLFFEAKRGLQAKQFGKHRQHRDITPLNDDDSCDIDVCLQLKIKLSRNV
jgi:hypothetical protein